MLVGMTTILCVSLRERGCEWKGRPWASESRRFAKTYGTKWFERGIVMDELENILAPDPTVEQIQKLLKIDPKCTHGYVKSAAIIYCSQCTSALLGLALMELEERA
jgi:hypothetical protein